MVNVSRQAKGTLNPTRDKYVSKASTIIAGWGSGILLCDLYITGYTASWARIAVRTTAVQKHKTRFIHGRSKGM